MIAVVHHIAPHYRYPVFRELCNSTEYQFVIISGTENSDGIKTVDKSLAEKPLDEGGLNWEFVKNRWLYKDILLWQTGLIRKCLEKRFTAYIFLGDVYYLSTWVCAILLRIRGKKFYYWTHGIYSQEKGIKKIIRKTFHKMADGFLLYGHYAAPILEMQGFNKNSIHVIYNSLDHAEQLKLRDSISLESLHKERTNYFKDSTLPQVIFIGRFIKQKKIDQLIEATKILTDNQFKINVLLVGEGEEELALKELVHTHDLTDQVYFYGASYDEVELYKLIARSDITVSPGEVGLNVMHSMVYGTPVITHNDMVRQGPEVEAIQPFVNGLLFSYNNIHELSNCIQSWIEKNGDRKRVQSACYKVVDEKYTPLHQTEIICSVLKNDQIISTS